MRLRIEGASNVFPEFVIFNKRNFLSHYPTEHLVDSRSIG
ncbi:MAG: hypothetical protein JWL75_319 [Parcubacteria group bacterium]|nr:hypothetical protein [Parcubacteria group bacterium]